MLKLLFNRTHQKFTNDSVSFSNEKYDLETYGMFLGINFNSSQQLALHIICAYQNKGAGFVNELRGSFSLILKDKLLKKTFVYTNQVGDKRVYYYQLPKLTIISDSILSISSFCKEHLIAININTQAAYQLLTFGYLLASETLIEGVKRLIPGQFLEYSNGKLTVIKYYSLKNDEQTNLREKDVVENIDALFRKAIQLEYEKDLQYQLHHLTSLSGGVDCRMNTWVAHDMNYQHITNFTFSQTGYWDQIIAQQIASDLNHEWIFKSLNFGAFLTNVETVMQNNEGATTYSNQTHLKNAIEILNFKKFGLMHTGQVGDVMIGSFISNDAHQKPFFSKYISNKLIHKLDKSVLNNYPNQELFLMYNRAFNGALADHSIIQQYTEVVSPFLDVDFMNYCLSIPLKLRKNHSIYKKWILQKYPKAADYIWESLGTTIRAKTIQIRGKSIPIKQIPHFGWKGLQFHLGLKQQNDTHAAFNMNPFDYWYKKNPALHDFFNRYYQENIGSITDKELKKDCSLLFNETTLEKMQVLSLLAVIKLIRN
ncbi:MAG: asparagine synthase [Bacteroidetes bacterium HGW-Bacteroidetes-4]|jgi:asparagine synthase (glutamine-hydrolysing)|nr:MAG: asparagine synthase [Bacteroidetes bacterium HGW-Bacteroidetes-4]